MSARKRIAVIGGGVAGIVSAHVLSRAHEVTLIEADSRLGGHANSVRVESGEEAPFEVDTAFLIFNSGSYPLFHRLLGRLGVEDAVCGTDMSMSFHNRDSGLQFAVNCGAAGLFADPRNALSPRFWKLLSEIRAFRAEADPSRYEGREAGTTLAEHLARTGKSRFFAENFAYPLGASVWSMPDVGMPEFPAGAFLKFFAHHKALKLEQGARWQTMRGGSIRYIRAFEERFQGRILKGQRVARVERSGGGARVLGSEGLVGEFDHVVLATHADQALRLLASPTEREQRLLGAWRYHSNPTLLHRDTSVLPAARRAWASWNIGFSGGREQKFLVTYLLNRIQPIAAKSPYLISLGENGVAPEQVLQRFEYRHPLFTSEAVATQRELPSLNEGGAISFCGSYFGHGFHEDAIRAAVGVASRFGLEL